MLFGPCMSAELDTGGACFTHKLREADTLSKMRLLSRHTITFTL
jgi:hypothetical protein